ncbi:hypothetical protein NDU88_000375 [Pleurodeles waltl]|uniref:Uncharacterized protein n=1 Tax=Pleurodeles waltl TaxID=8319 RepID=A0AAV7V4Y3_PLEWA|nr:hypothetical protein NDU88_000375 [Pleurodeles waltl]
MVLVPALWCSSPPCGARPCPVVLVPALCCLPPPCGARPRTVVLIPALWCSLLPCGARPCPVLLAPTLWCSPPPCGARPRRVVLVPALWCLPLSCGARLVPGTWQALPLCIDDLGPPIICNSLAPAPPLAFKHFVFPDVIATVFPLRTCETGERRPQANPVRPLIP